MALSYTDLFSQSQRGDFISRVEMGLFQYAINEPGIMMSPPPSGGSVTVAAQRDRLARSILASPRHYAEQFAPCVATKQIAKPSLGEGDVSDADIYASIGATYDQNLAPL